MRADRTTAVAMFCIASFSAPAFGEEAQVITPFTVENGTFEVRETISVQTEKALVPRAFAFTHRYTLRFDEFATQATGRCFGMGAISAAEGDSHGVCENIDKDGDQFDYEWTCFDHRTRGERCWGYGRGRSGKYAGKHVTITLQAAANRFAGGGSFMNP